jgi:DNA-directed RNA polymerase II subunit RPB2
MCTHVSAESSVYPVLFCLGKLGMINVDIASSLEVQRKTKVLVNGDFVGVLPSLKETIRIVTLLKYLRRTGVLSKYISIAWHQDIDTVTILGDGGRYSTPYYIIDEDGHFQMDHWVRVAGDGGLPDIDVLSSKLEGGDIKDYPYNASYRGEDYHPWEQSAIEYIDTNEEETAVIAVRPEQLYSFQTLRPSGSDYVGHLTLSVDLPKTAEERDAYHRELDERGHVRSVEDGVDGDHAERRSQQDAQTQREISRMGVPLMDRILERLDEQPRHIFQSCVKDVELVDSKRRLIKVITEGELDTVQTHLLTNLNRFLSREYVTYTHCILHPSTIHGIVAANIPFPDHNQSPRNCYQSSMGKQSVGTYVSNPNQRMDTMANILVYPQVPITATRYASITHLDKLHHGYNAMIAIACYSGYNQEDSLVGSKAAAQRGAYNTAYYRTYSATLQKPLGSDASESFEVPPDRTIGRKIGSGGVDRYHAIVRNYGKKGHSPELPEIGAIVHGNDIIIPKCKKVTNKKKAAGAGVAGPGETLYTDLSVTVKPSDTGVVDMVIPNEQIPNNENEDGYQFVKVRLCENREPEIGDKFASRAAQKGTEGIQLNAADIMFNSHGIAPDKIMNPQAIPSRMTEGHLIESLCNKHGALTGTFHDATPFTDFDLEQMKGQLGMTGYDRCGDEIMYNGQTGEPLESPVVFWPTYYQRLKHMVTDKMHARSLGPIQALTKQPTEGRSRGGGLRVGEMERDCIIAHGAALFLKEKTMECSDAFPLYVSEDAKKIISANTKAGIYQIGTKEIYGTDKISSVHMPYAMNLFRQELMCQLIGLDVTTDK